jgi:hypothetical protein
MGYRTDWVRFVEDYWRLVDERSQERRRQKARFMGAYTDPQERRARYTADRESWRAAYRFSKRI